MVQVQSSWFPLIDRNPQTFVPNIFAGEGLRLQSADASHLPERRRRVVYPSFRGECRWRNDAFLDRRARDASSGGWRAGRRHHARPIWRHSIATSRRPRTIGTVPALAIAIVKDDSLVFAKGYGVLEIGKSAPANEHTRFAIGSTTKAMTSASLAMLVDDGKLHWDDHVTDYIPELQLYDPYATRELTIRDLLTHRSGLPGTDLFWVRWHVHDVGDHSRLRYMKPESSFRSTGRTRT